MAYGPQPPHQPLRRSGPAAGGLSPVYVIVAACAAFLALLVGVVIGIAAADASPETAPGARPTVTVTTTKTAQPAAAATPSAPPSPTKAAAPTTVKMPNVVGKNGAVAQAKLEGLGLDDITFGSADDSASVVLLPQNWKVVKQDPRAGAKVKPGAKIVLTMIKLS